MGDVWSMDPLRAGAAAAAVAAGGVACLCCVIPEPPAEPSAAPPAAPPPAAPPADDAGAAMGDLLRAQALVERLRPVALAFQEATLRSKAESQRQLDAAEGELAAFVRQHAAHVRNRDASLRLLRGLRIVMDVMLGAEMPTDDDSWSESEGESEDESEGDVAAKIAARLQAIEREATLLEKRAQRLPSDPAAPSSVPGRAPTVESRGQLLQDEAAALGAAVLDPPAGSTSARMRALAVLVDDLRVAEGSFEFQRTLMQAHQRLGSTTAYSRDNFAYGSTPWQSWIKVHTDPGCRELAAAVQRCAAAGSALPEYVVFGSSLGWLCFYAAFSLSVRAVGYEIVDPLVEMAEQLRSRHCCGDVAGAGCSIAFHCQDMLTAPLDRCGVLLLTSRCWDKPLARALHARLIRDLPDESVVVDYNDDLAKAMPDTDPGTDPDAAMSSSIQRESFEVIGSCVVPVSWDSQQRMYVMRRRQR